MKLLRRAFLHLAAGAAALPAASRIAYPQSPPTVTPSEPSVRTLAEGLAAYADGLRYDDIDAATIERVKTHVIDTIGCGIGAFDERPVSICRNVALAVSVNATIIGTDRRTTPDLASFANGAASTSMTHMWDAFPFIRAIILRRASRWRRPSGPAHRI